MMCVPPLTAPVVAAVAAILVVCLVVGPLGRMDDSCVGTSVTGSSHFSESENGEHCIKEF